MRRLLIAVSRLLDPLRRRSREARLHEEMREHLDRLTAEFVARGLPPDEAALAARRAFGGVDQVAAAVRDQRGWPWLDSLVQDLRFAGRYLLRDRAFAVPVVLVLALGIGVGHMFLTLTYAHVLRGLPIEDVERVLAVSTIDARAAVRGVSYPDVLDLRESQRAFVDLAAWSNTPVTLGDEGQVPDRVQAAFTTASGFVMIGVRPLVGRGFSAADDAPAAAPTVVLTERVWRSRYHGDSGVIGREVLVNGAATTVIGVVSDRSGFPSGAAVFLPLAALPGLADAARGTRTLQVFGRLTGTATPADAAADLDAIAEQLARRFPATNDGVRLLVEPLNYRLLGGAGTVRGWLPFITAGLIVLAVASTNAGNLLLVGATGRAREVAVRTALGASRLRIARQLLVEALLMAAAAAAVGMALSRAGVGIYRQWIPDGILPYWFDYSLNPWLVVALAAMALLTVVVFAVVPALHASRTAAVDVLKDGGRTETGRRALRAGGSAFLGLQLGLAIVLIVQVGIANLTPAERLATDPRLDDPRVLTGTVTLPGARYPTPDARRRFLVRLTDRLGALPGVAAVAFASHAPLGGAFERTLTIEGRAADLGAPASTMRVVEVSPGYFAMLDLGLVRGRDLTVAGGEPESTAVLVNERFAARYFPGADPLGRRLTVAAPAASETPPWRTIVGIVPDVRHGLTQPAAVPIVYAPLLGLAPANATLFVRGTGDGASLTGAVRESLRQLDGLVPLDRARSLPAATRDAAWAGRVSATLANTVCAAAFALAVAGLFAVVSHRTARRRREIGLRMALGADPIRIAWLVVGSVRGAVGLGLVLGLLGVVAWNRAFAPVGPDARTVGLGSILAVVVALLLTVLAGCLLPAGRATRISPGDALRRE
ncbi:MAG: ABC transporter permease [Vicinamibacterales bacterium]